MANATTVDKPFQQSCSEAMLHASVEVHLLIGKANELERDNVRLRELVRDLLPFAEVGLETICPVKRCFLYGECGHTPTRHCHAEERVKERLCKLGFEVDE